MLFVIFLSFDDQPTFTHGTFNQSLPHTTWTVSEWLFFGNKKTLILDRNQCSSRPWIWFIPISFKIPHFQVDSNLLRHMLFCCLLGNLSKVNVQIPWSSMISCMDPPSRPWKFANTRRPSASKGSNKTSPGERQNCWAQPSDLVGLRCSLLNWSFHSKKQQYTTKWYVQFPKKNKSYILMYGYHRK